MGTWGFFYFLATENMLLGTFVHEVLCELLSSGLLGIYTEMELQGHKATLRFAFGETVLFWIKWSREALLIIDIKRTWEGGDLNKPYLEMAAKHTSRAELERAGRELHVHPWCITFKWQPVKTLIIKRAIIFQPPDRNLLSQFIHSNFLHWLIQISPNVIWDSVFPWNRSWRNTQHYAGIRRNTCMPHDNTTRLSYRHIWGGGHE